MRRGKRERQANAPGKLTTQEAAAPNPELTVAERTAKILKEIREAASTGSVVVLPATAKALFNSEASAFLLYFELLAGDIRNGHVKNFASYERIVGEFMDFLETTALAHARGNICRILDRYADEELGAFAEHPEFLESRKAFIRRFGGNDNIGYTKGIMGETAAFRAAAAEEGFSVGDFRKIVNRAKAAKAELTERETGKRAKEEPRPETSSSPATPDFAEAAHDTTTPTPKAGRLLWNKDNTPDENPAAFAWRAYAVEAAAGTLHRGVIAREDKDLAKKLANWLRTHPMPEGVDIPSKPEWNTRRLAALPAPPRPVRVWTEEGRLSQVARYRAAKTALAKM